MAFFSKKTVEKPTKAYIINTLKTPLGVFKANELWNELCLAHSVNPDDKELDLNTLENILMDLIKKEGVIGLCGKSMLMKLVSYTSQI